MLLGVVAVSDSGVEEVEEVELAGNDVLARDCRLGAGRQQGREGREFELQHRIEAATSAGLGAGDAGGANVFGDVPGVLGQRVPKKNILGKAGFVWMSCDKMIPYVPIICNPFTIRWTRFGHTFPK